VIQFSNEIHEDGSAVVAFFSGTPDECRDSLSIHERFCHVNVPLLRGHPMDAAIGQDILVMSLLKQTVSENMAIVF